MMNDWKRIADAVEQVVSKMSNGDVRPEEYSNDISRVAAGLGQIAELYSGPGGGGGGGGTDTMIADAYSAESTYAVGDYCTHGGKLYVCSTEISTAEQWTEAHWTETVLGDEVADLKSAKEDVLEKTYTTIMDASVTTADDGEHISPYGSYSGVSLVETRKYRLTFDGVEVETGAAAWFEKTGNTFKGIVYLGNISLYNVDMPDVVNNDSTKPYCIIYNPLTYSGLQILTSNAGTHSIKIETISYSKGTIPNTLIWGNEDATIRREYKDSSYMSAEIGHNASSARGTVAIGNFNNMSSEYGIAIGMMNTVSGNFAIATGYNNVSSGQASFVEGDNNTASGDGSHAEGKSNVASGLSSHAEGAGCTASATASHAEGSGSVASQTYSHAEGYETQAKKSYAHAEGANSIANGNCSHAEGYKTEANAICAHAEGRETIAMGAGSHTNGYYNIADSYADWDEWAANTSYSVGDKVKRTTASGGTTTVAGYICKTANSDSSFTSSKWTTDTKINYAVITGNGTAANARSNAYALGWDGNGHYAGDVYVGCNTDSTGGTKLARIPDPPSTDGTYVLQATVSSGIITYTWVSAI